MISDALLCGAKKEIHMIFLEETNKLLSGVILPLVLIPVGIFIAARLRFFYVFHPVRSFRALKSSAGGGGTSPLKALTMALAGTLGVGNISGVASAIASGGAGAVFWMWVSALCAMSLKYAEVFLAVKYRVTDSDGSHHHGGAPYYMKAALSPRLGGKAAGGLASFFAVLLVSNSVLTGNVVQVNAASGVFAGVPGIVCGAAIALTVLAVTAGGVRRIGDFTVFAIPFLTLVYVALSLFIIFSNTDRIVPILGDIVRNALSPRAAVGGVFGYGVSRAVRYGVTRGIFSNEAGCGTAPSAHAAANTDSPHAQGCLGIFEVFCDTIVMCTMTALVILLAGESAEGGIALSMKSYGAFCGKAGEIAIGVSVIIFALATVICQEFYGMEALRFLGARSGAIKLYLVISFAATLAGSVMSSSLVWQLADLQIAAMTVVNTLTLFILSDHIPRQIPAAHERKVKEAFK